MGLGLDGKVQKWVRELERWRGDGWRRCLFGKENEGLWKLYLNEVDGSVRAVTVAVKPLCGVHVGFQCLYLECIVTLVEGGLKVS